MLYDDLSLEVFSLRNELRDTKVELEVLRTQLHRQQEVINMLRGTVAIMAVFVALILVLVLFVYPLQVLLS